MDYRTIGSDRGGGNVSPNYFRPLLNVACLLTLQILKQNTEVPTDANYRKEMSTQTAMNAVSDATLFSSACFQ